MNDDMLVLLDIMGAIFIIAGISILNSPRASKPNVRIYGSIGVIIGCTSLAILMYNIGKPGSFATQVGVMAFSILGIVNCLREIGKQENVMVEVKIVIQKIDDYIGRCRRGEFNAPHWTTENVLEQLKKELTEEKR